MTRTTPSKPCPVCGGPTYVKSYGPFFTPNLVYRYALACYKYCWRGSMRATREEAVE